MQIVRKYFIGADNRQIVGKRLRKHGLSGYYASGVMRVIGGKLGIVLFERWLYDFLIRGVQ